MPDYIVDVSDEFFPQYDDQPKEIKKKFRKQLKLLKSNPKHKSLQIHRIEGTYFWEFYVDMGYRCIFKQEGSIYKVYYIGTHKLIDRI